MVNNLNEKRSYAVIIAAIITSLVIILSGVISGLALAVNRRRDSGGNSAYAHFLLVDSAGKLKSSLSAMRLCNEPEPASELAKTALVHAVRAETALECKGDDWSEDRTKEAFLNDLATVLHSYEPMQAVELADTLYEYSVKFFDCVNSGADFEYNGEIMGGGSEEGNDTAPTDEQISAAGELVGRALGTTRAEYLGAWSGHLEFNVERDGRAGYALVCGDKIIEFSFMRDTTNADMPDDNADKIALETAKACGYDSLVVRASEKIGQSTAVLMCREFDGAVACDDIASAVVYGGEVVAFSAGNCDCEHNNVPKVKRSESEARRSAVGGGVGALVVRRLDGKERICYEYRYELDDGTHYVYVCAESGKQIEVK